MVVGAFLMYFESPADFLEYNAKPNGLLFLRDFRLLEHHDLKHGARLGSLAYSHLIVLDINVMQLHGRGLISLSGLKVTRVWGIGLSCAMTDPRGAGGPERQPVQGLARLTDHGS